MSIRTTPYFESKDHISSTSVLEKIISCWNTFLSDEELLCVLIGSGVKGHSVFKLAQAVLKLVDQSRDITLEQLIQIHGLGKNKAMVILAALEMSRRLSSPAHWKITRPEDVLPLLMHYADRQQEHFIVLCLNGAHCVSYKHVVSVGIVNKALVHPREVFSIALLRNSAAIVVAHNHPSGEVQPSDDDIFVTKKLHAVSQIMDIPLLDHIIFSMHSHYSFASEGFFGQSTIDT